MEAAARKLKEAIENRWLKIKPGPPTLGRFPEIILVIKRDEFACLKCLAVSPPRAWLDDSGKMVHIRASEGLPGGFDVACDTE